MTDISSSRIAISPSPSFGGHYTTPTYFWQVHLANISILWQDYTANVLDGPRRKTTALAASLANIA
jgi:hypothetical protein